MPKYKIHYRTIPFTLGIEWVTSFCGKTKPIANTTEFKSEVTCKTCLKKLFPKSNSGMDWEMYDDIIKNCKEIGIRKNKGYGTESLKLFNGTAILSRMNDKIQRLNNLWENKNNTVPDETIDDTTDDLINYAIYLRMLRKGGIS